MSAENCPICNEPQLINPQPGVLECQYCHAKIVNGLLICPSCKRANQIGQEHCNRCGEPLSVVGTVINRQIRGSASQRLDQMRVQANEIKASAEKHSRARMSEFTELDQRRIQAEKQAAQEQKLRDQTILRNAAIGAGVFLLIVTIISLIFIL